MLYVLGALTALQIVAAQTLWKIGLGKIDFELTRDFVLSSHMLKVIFSPYILAGVLLYASATLLFFGMLSRYSYANTQTIVVTSSLILTFFSALLIFNEHFRLIHLLGIGCLLLGVLLITKF